MPVFVLSAGDPLSGPALFLGLLGILAFAAFLGGAAFAIVALYASMSTSVDETRAVRLSKLIWILIVVLLVVLFLGGFVLYYAA